GYPQGLEVRILRDQFVPQALIGPNESHVDRAFRLQHRGDGEPGEGEGDVNGPIPERLHPVVVGEIARLDLVKADPVYDKKGFQCRDAASPGRSDRDAAPTHIPDRFDGGGLQSDDVQNAGVEQPQGPDVIGALVRLAPVEGEVGGVGVGNAQVRQTGSHKPRVFDGALGDL